MVFDPKTLPDPDNLHAECARTVLALREQLAALTAELNKTGAAYRAAFEREAAWAKAVSDASNCLTEGLTHIPFGDCGCPPPCKHQDPILLALRKALNQALRLCSDTLANVFPAARQLGEEAAFGRQVRESEVLMADTAWRQRVEGELQSEIEQMYRIGSGGAAQRLERILNGTTESEVSQ